MSKLITVIFFILWFPFCFAQQQETPSLLVVDSLWAKEIFKFPIHFAPELNYIGFEEAYFPKDWSDQNSPDYWSYVFVWNIEGKSPINEAILEHNLQFYFDGLMNVVNKDKDFEVPKSTIVFVENLETSYTSYKGKVRLFNSFHTKRMMTLNALVSVFYCEDLEKTFVFFRFSPSDYDTEIWKTLLKIKPSDNICD
ncbi:hypothetical protein M0G43_08215 [Subsaxibacter sp. CAU 1640]|uniref:hypothetical protein n=1 Tax=Subsaxibacter sp. CAU 1640 TaxID=2933271 RepID=UPI00200664E8|nr:hypothetical protein [Subsaxibacter sp. CAU 1640]MCK7590553.1 hypothetical protein [Subsaxibacter sp. CAU 1640]